MPTRPFNSRSSPTCSGMLLSGARVKISNTEQQNSRVRCAISRMPSLQSCRKEAQTTLPPHAASSSLSSSLSAAIDATTSPSSSRSTSGAPHAITTRVGGPCASSAAASSASCKTPKLPPAACASKGSTPKGTACTGGSVSPTTPPAGMGVWLVERDAMSGWMNVLIGTVAASPPPPPPPPPPPACENSCTDVRCCSPCGACSNGADAPSPAAPWCGTMGTVAR
mmetsp:Transcript_15064/g.30263  ORF Transcript_15064/g.30263 Transcript_15064/m.30263 type:complete len:224 (+) Transcript_15064:1031-1702(+)